MRRQRFDDMVVAMLQLLDHMSHPFGTTLFVLPMDRVSIAAIDAAMLWHHAIICPS
jgi:hypothetical protein